MEEVAYIVMFEIGKLYRYTCVWSTGLYRSHDQIGAFNKIRQNDIFVLLEQNKSHFKILTSDGEIGWITGVPKNFQEVSE